MTREQIEQAADFIAWRNVSKAEIIDFTLSQVRLAFEECAKIVETKTLSRPNHLGAMGLVDRREPSLTALLIAQAIRAAAPKE